MHVLTTAFTFSLFCAAILAGDEGKSDLGNYSLFNPAPKESLRPLQSEGFDRVMNPFTVDAGHFQMEANLGELYYTSSRGTFPSGTTYNFRAEQFAWAPTFKVGLLDNLDFEVTPTYFRQSTRQAGTFPGGFPYTIKNDFNNFGRITTAAKVNLWGNNEGTTSFALKPYLSIPTQNGDLLGGVEAAAAFRLPQQMTLKLSSGIEAIENNRHATFCQFANGLTLDKMFGRKTTVFINLNAYITSQKSQDWWGYTGFGAAYNLTKNFQVYAGMRFGLEAGYDYDPYVGITWRY